MFGLGLLIVSSAAHGHFLLNINIRTVHVQHLDDGLRVLLRLPLPYVLANLVGESRADGTVEPAPFTHNRIEDGALVHYIDVDALSRDPLGLGRLVADGHGFEVYGARLEAQVEAVRVYTAADQPPFASLDEALRAFAGNPQRFADDLHRTYVGDAVVDVMLRYETTHSVNRYRFASTLNPGLEGQSQTANLLLDYFPGETRVFRVRGLLDEPVTVVRSDWAAALTFAVEGMRHILEGLDHLLFVLCMTIGASTLRDLLWRVTGFTVGHTLTLVLGFLGYAPSAAWFIPGVEMAIALSIIYAAIIAVSERSGTSALLVTTAIGLVHGLGFSFFLHEILRVDSPNLWQSLLSFNIGVEVGQLAIVVVVWPLLRWSAHKSERLATAIRWSIAIPCIGVASFWLTERATALLESLSV